MRRTIRGLGVVLGAIVGANGCVTQARNYGGAQPSEDASSADVASGETDATAGVQTGGVSAPGSSGSSGTGGPGPGGGTSGSNSSGGQTGLIGATDDTTAGTETAIDGPSTEPGGNGTAAPETEPSTGPTASAAASTDAAQTSDGANSEPAISDSLSSEHASSDDASSEGPVNPPDPTSSSESSSSSGSTTGQTTSTDTPPTVPAVDEYFVDWPAGTEPLDVGKQAAAIFTSKSLPTGSGHSNTDDYKHYKDACAWYGALSVALVAGERLLIDSLVAKYEPYKGTWGGFNPPTTQNAMVGNVDDSLFGIVPLAIAKHREDAIYVEEGDIAADHQIAFMDQQKRYTSDDMFMITALQVQAYRAITDSNHRKRHLDIAAETMVEYLEDMQRSDGLIPHHLDREDYAIAWGRGNGWFAAGMAELIQELPSNHPDYDAISDGYIKMMNGLLSYQIPQGQTGAGLWKQVVDSSDSRNWPESSGSAMFTYALVSGVRAGRLDVDTFGPAARNAWIGLVGQLTANGEVKNISDWAYLPESHGLPANQYAGDEENYYFQRSKLTGDGHGQSPLMWSAAALARPLD